MAIPIAPGFLSSRSEALGMPLGLPKEDALIGRRRRSNAALALRFAAGALFLAAFCVPPDASALEIGDFVLYGERSVNVAAFTHVDGGDIGVVAVAGTSFGPQLKVGDHAQIDAGHDLLSPSTSLGLKAKVGDVQTNLLQNDGASLGMQDPFPGGLPPMPLAGFGVPGSDVHVANHASVTLAPGNYGALAIGQHSNVSLTAGAYSFTAVTMDQHSSLTGAAAGVSVQVIGRLAISGWDDVEPSGGAAAGKLTLLVGGSDASVGLHSKITALLAAPNGTLSIAPFVHATGAFAGFDVVVGEHGQIEFQSGFTPTVSGTPGSQKLKGYYGNPTDGAFAVTGPVPPNAVFNLDLGLPVRDPVGLKTFIDDVSNPISASYRLFITPTQFKQTYGATDGDYQQLTNWAQSVGFTVQHTFSNNLLLSVNATAAQIEQALHVNLVYREREDGSNTQFITVDREPSIDFDVPILWITGLADNLLPKPKCTPCMETDPSVLNGTANSKGYFSSDLRAAYLGGPSSRCLSLDGTAETIGIVSFEGFDTADVASYAAANPPISAGNVNVVYGSNPGAANTTGETILDITMAQAMAPAAQIQVFLSGTGITGHADDVLHAMATDSTVLSTASSSWGFAGSDNSQQALSQMAAQGTSFFEASGDYGDIGDPQGVDDMDHLTLVGGTFLSTAPPISSARPNPTYPSNYYVSEATWNRGCPFTGTDVVFTENRSCEEQSCNGSPCPQCPLLPCPLCPAATSSNFCASGNSGQDITGGGIMDGHENAQMQPGGDFGVIICNCWPYPFCCGNGVPIPGYQSPSLMQPIASGGNGGSLVFRNFPDVAMVADDVVVFSKDGQGFVGGTSASAPLWAGFMALADQLSRSNGMVGPVGFANWALYEIGETKGLPGANDLYAQCFHDIKDGVFNSATDNCDNGCTPAVRGFPAVAGYDLATGWGTPTCALIQQLATSNPTVSSTFDSIALHLENGHDGVNDQSSVSLDVFGPDANTQIGHFVIKPQGAPHWDGIGLVFDQHIPLPAPIPADGIDHVVINLEENGQGGINGDNWDIGGFGLRLGSFHTPKACEFDLSSNGGCIVQEANGVPNCDGNKTKGDGYPAVVRLSADFNNAGSGVGPTISFSMSQFGCLPAMSPGGGEPFVALEIVLDTGDDDLREGSELDLGIFDASNTNLQQSILKVSGAPTFKDQTEHSFKVPLTTPLMLADIDHLVLSLNNAGNDEWHLNGVDVYGVAAAGWQTCLAVAAGNPIQRLTSATSQTIPKDLNSCP